MRIPIPSALFVMAVAAGDSGSTDSLRAALATRLEGAPTVRVTTAAGQRVGHATVTAAGLDFGPSSFRGMEGHEPNLVSWSDIQSVDVGHSQVRNGAMIGLLTGVAAAVVWNASDPPESDAGFLQWGATGTGKAVARTLLTAVFGTALGAGIGNRMQTWEPIHP